VRSLILAAVWVCWLLGGPTAAAAELHDAIRAQDLGRVSQLLKSGANINEIELDGSPLHLAVVLGFIPAVQLLLQAGADPELPGEPVNAHALHAAAHANQPVCAELLIKFKANMEARDAEDRTPLMVAALFGTPEVARVLVQHGANIAATEAQFRATALHFAAFKGDAKTVEVLLASSGVNVDAKNRSGGSPLFVAARRGHLPVVKLLIAKGADFHLRDKDGKTVLSYSRGAVADYLATLGLRN
jgi:uncharacterized protein